MLIGITGTDGSGKGTVVDYLVRTKGFLHCSARDLLGEELALRNIESTRANLRLIGNELREQYGNDFLITHYLKKIKEKGARDAVIESIRATAEAETLKREGGILIAVDAGQRLRYERVQGRRSSSDRVSFDQFVAHEELESNDPNPHGMQKQKVIAMADFVIFNNGTFEDLAKQIEEMWQKIG